MSELYLQVNSGLASRLRAVIGGIAYCEATGKSLVVDWPLVERSEKLGTFEARIADLWHHPYEERISGHVWPTSENGDLSSAGNVRLRTCHVESFMPWFREPIGNYLNRMTPTEAVQREINSVYIPKGVPLIGVNVRFSLKHPETVGLEWFVERMRQFPPEVHFFGAFDSMDVYHEVRKAFLGRVQSTMKGSDLYDFDGIVRACADLYVLQKCDWVVGSNHSSYSQLAAFMRGAEYVGDHEKPNGIRGGRYEDAWNPPDEAELEKAMAK